MKKITINHALEVLSAIILFGVIIFTIYIYNRMAPIIPVHYNLAGEADSLGAKSEIWLVVALEVITYIGLSILQKYPHKYNYPVQVTESNKQQLFFLGVRVILIMKLFIVLLYSYITLCMTGIIELDMWILVPGTMLFAIVIPILFIVKMSRIRP